MSARCVFARPGDPLSAHHDHATCRSTLAFRDSHWHPESVVIATRRLIALAHSVPPIDCASCGDPVHFDGTDGWVHETGRPCGEPAGYLAYPDAGQYAELAETAWRDDRLSIAPFAAARILEEFGVWGDDVGAAYTLLSMLLPKLEPHRLDGMHPLSAVMQAVSRVGADGTVAPTGLELFRRGATERAAAESRAIEESNARQDAFYSRHPRG